MRLYLFSNKSSEETFENAQWRKVKQMQSMWLCNMHALIQVHWGHIWKPIVEKSQTNATNVTLPLFGQTIWGHIWKRIVKTNLNKCSKCDFACSDPSSLKKWQFFIMSKTSHDLHKSITNIDSWNLNCIEYTNSFIFGRDKLILSARKNMVKGSKTWLG